MNRPAKVAKYAAAIADLTGYTVDQVEEKTYTDSELTFWHIRFSRVLGGNGLADRQGWVSFVHNSSHGHTSFVGGSEYQPLLSDEVFTQRKDLDFWLRTRSYS